MSSKSFHSKISDASLPLTRPQESSAPYLNKPKHFPLVAVVLYQRERKAKSQAHWSFMEFQEQAQRPHKAAAMLATDQSPGPKICTCRGSFCLLQLHQLYLQVGVHLILK